MSAWTVLAASSMEAMVRKIRGVLHMRERQPRPRHHSGRLHQDAENLGGTGTFAPIVMIITILAFWKISLSALDFVTIVQCVGLSD